MAVIPSSTGGGITRAAELIFQALEARRSRAQVARRLDIDEQIAAVNQFTTLAGFLEPGTTLGDLGESGMALFSKAFDMPSEGLEAIDLREETLDMFVNTRTKALLEASPEGADLLNPAVRARLGLEPSEDVANLRDLSAQMQAQSLTEILEDPDLMGEFVERTLGRNPVRMRIPGVEGEISFDGPTAANIYAQFLLVRERFGFELSTENVEARKGLVEEIQKAVAAAGQSVSSPAIEGRIFQLYNSAVQSGDVSGITEFLNNPGTTPGEKLAMEFMLGSIGVGENTVLNNLPPAMRNFLTLAQAIREILGPEEAAKLLPTITEALDPSEFGRFERTIFGKLGFEIPGEVSPDLPADAIGGIRRPSENGGPTAAAVPRDVRLEAAGRLLIDRSMNREDLVATLGEDVVAEAEANQPTPETEDGIPESGVNPDSVPPARRAEAERLNRLLSTLEGTSGELARRNLQNVIDRLRTNLGRN